MHLFRVPYAKHKKKSRQNYKSIKDRASNRDILNGTQQGLPSISEAYLVLSRGVLKAHMLVFEPSV